MSRIVCKVRCRFLQYENSFLNNFLHLNPFILLHAYQKLIAPATHHNGWLWENNDFTVVEEHLKTNMCNFTISRLAHVYAKPKEQKLPAKAMFHCLEREQHHSE